MTINVVKCLKTISDINRLNLSLIDLCPLKMCRYFMSFSPSANLDS